MLTSSVEGMKVILPWTVFRSCLSNESILLTTHIWDVQRPDFWWQPSNDESNLGFPLRTLAFNTFTCREILVGTKLRHVYVSVLLHQISNNCCSEDKQVIGLKKIFNAALCVEPMGFCSRYYRIFSTLYPDQWQWHSLGHSWTRPS